MKEFVIDMDSISEFDWIFDNLLSLKVLIRVRSMLWGCSNKLGL